jgi:glycosyltransferase involved in cell wall biosynthesis
MDVAIAPLQMNNFNDSKSDIKVAECSRYKIPLVASNVGCYDETIINGETGYLIDPDAPKSEWVKILTKLCKDKKHRIELGQNLHDRTKDLYDGRKQSQLRYDLYVQAIKDTGYKLDEQDNQHSD